MTSPPAAVWEWKESFSMMQPPKQTVFGTQPAESRFQVRRLISPSSVDA